MAGQKDKMREFSRGSDRNILKNIPLTFKHCSTDSSLHGVKDLCW